MLLLWYYSQLQFSNINFLCLTASDESPRKVKKQKVGKGFLAPLQLSDALAKFIGTGENELPRYDVVKRMWNYIKQNNLQVSQLSLFLGCLVLDGNPYCCRYGVACMGNKTVL